MTEIHSRYIDVIRAINSKHLIPGGSARHTIPSDAGLSDCMAYTEKYVIGDENHYRFTHYTKALNWCMKTRRFDPEEHKPICHVDIGCGPGLFTWAVNDYLHANSIFDFVLYGYDHARNMVWLAKKIWDRLQEKASYSCYDSDEELLGAISNTTKPCHFLFTFGYVLVQNVREPDVIEKFANIIAKTARIASCQIVAADAHKALSNRYEDFRKACGDLEYAMKQHGLKVKMCVSSRSWMCATVKKKGG